MFPALSSCVPSCIGSMCQSNLALAILISFSKERSLLFFRIQYKSIKSLARGFWAMIKALSVAMSTRLFMRIPPFLSGGPI